MASAPGQRHRRRHTLAFQRFRARSGCRRRRPASTIDFAPLRHSADITPDKDIAVSLSVEAKRKPARFRSSQNGAEHSGPPRLERRRRTEVIRAAKREHDMRLNIALMAALLLVPLGPAAATTSVTRTVKVTKTVTVRTVTARKTVRTVRRKAFRRHVSGAQTVAFARRIHPESCFLPPHIVVALNALGPYCDSPRGWRRIVARY